MSGEITKVKRSELAHFLKTGANTFDRIRKATSGTVNMNPQTTTEQYIDEDSATTSVEGYQVSMEAPMTAYAGDPIFEYLLPLYNAHAIGAEVESEYLEVHKFKTSGTNAYEAKKNNCAISISSFGGDAGAPVSLTFTVNINGDPTLGTATIDAATGQATFTAAS